MRGWPCRHAKRIVVVNGFHYHKIGINLMERVLDKGAQVVARKNISPSSSLCWTQTASSATDGCLPLADRSTHSGPVTMGVKVVIRIIVPLVECRRWTTSTATTVTTTEKDWCSVENGRVSLGWRWEEEKCKKFFRHPRTRRSSLCPFDKIIRIHLISIVHD